MSRDTEKGKYPSTEGSQTWEYIAAAICAIGAINIGIAASWDAPSLPELMSPGSRIPTTPEEISTLASAPSIGGLPSPILSLLIVNKIGLKKTMLLSNLLFTISWILILIAKSINILIVARSIAGCSMGLSMFVIPLYMGEALSSRLRGSLGPAVLTAFSFGIFFIMSVGPYFGYQITSGICLLMGISSLISCCFIPESPYFLIKSKRIEEAKSTLIKLRGKEDVSEEIELIEATLREKGKTLLKSDKLLKIEDNEEKDKDKDEKVKLEVEVDDENAKENKENILKQIFLIRGNLKSFVILVVINFLQSCSGLGTFLSYFGIIFHDMGANVDVKKASTIFGVLQIVSGLASFIVIDKFKRRMIFFTGGMSVSFLIGLIGIYFYLIEYEAMDVQKYVMIPYLSVFIYLIALNIGILSIMGILASELLAPDVKVPVSCIIGIINSIRNIIFTKFYLLIAVSWGFGHSIPFIGYALSTFLCTIIIMWLLPETKGKTLLDIQRALNA